MSKAIATEFGVFKQLTEPTEEEARHYARHLRAPQAPPPRRSRGPVPIQGEPTKAFANQVAWRWIEEKTNDGDNLHPQTAGWAREHTKRKVHIFQHAQDGQKYRRATLLVAPDGSIEVAGRNRQRRVHIPKSAQVGKPNR